MRPLLARMGDGAARFLPPSISVYSLFVTRRAIMAIGYSPFHLVVVILPAPARGFSLPISRVL